jgi:hypothetical protein
MLDSINYEIFKFDLDTARLNLALLKENFEYRTFFEKFIKSIDDTSFSFPAYYFEKFGLPGVRFTVGAPCYNDVLELLDPYKKVKLDSKREDNILSKIFYFPSVMQVEFNTSYIKGIASRTFESIERKKTKPHERIFIADLRKKKKQLLREFSEFIDATYNQSDLKPDNSRFRAEAWTHLKVWKLRRKRLSFSNIAEQLKLTEGNARKSFYRAYELTQGRKYDPEMLRRQVWLVRKKELQKTCDNCPDRDTCTVLCPDILRFIDQDTLNHSKEKLF